MIYICAHMYSMVLARGCYCDLRTGRGVLPLNQGRDSVIRQASGRQRKRINDGGAYPAYSIPYAAATRPHCNVTRSAHAQSTEELPVHCHSIITHTTCPLIGTSPSRAILRLRSTYVLSLEYDSSARVRMHVASLGPCQRTKLRTACAT